MIYHDFQGEKLSLLGFGAMRLPLLADGSVDEVQTTEMVRYALDHGVNYFDTAYPYHSGESERVLGRALKAAPRDSYFLATKFPGHQVAQRYDPKAIFEEQLQKCGVDGFDFYLLHNVYENSVKTYEDSRWGIIDYFVEQKRLGRIRHLGFSTHAGVDCLRAFLDAHGADMEFCQIQMNYLDWTLQDARAKYELLTKRGIPVWVMEPVRGGKLVKLGERNEAALRALNPSDSAATWAFRFLQGLPNVTVVLSGMSSMEQMRQNLETFAEERPLSAEENGALLRVAEGLKNAIPCTGCRYCCDGCPMGLDIPTLLMMCNEMRYAPGVSVGMRMDAFPSDKRPSACVGCGACSSVCPQKIDVPAALQELAQALEKLPKWADLCAQRAAAQK